MSEDILTQNNWETMNNAVTLIHGIRGSRSMRTAFLQKLITLVDFNYADFSIGRIDPRNGTHFTDPVILSQYNKAFEQKFTYEYENNFGAIDYANWLFQGPKSVVYRDSDLINEDLRKQSPFYTNYLKPFDLVHVAGFAVINSGVLLGACTLYRSEKKDNFSDRDLYILNQFLPHFEQRFEADHAKVNEDAKGVSTLLRNEYRLTNREIEIVGLVFYGCRTEDIAQKLDIAPNTVKKHISNIFDKMNVKSRPQLIQFIIQNNLVNTFSEYAPI